MDNKECEFKYKCHYSNDDCSIIKDVCVHREKLIEIIKLGDQYTAVVAQNKSLQGELIKRREYLLQAQNEVLQLIIGTQEKRHAKYIFSVLNKILEREA